MSFVSPYIHPAKLVSYDKANRTAKVAISGLTDGVEDGITAMLAYPIGDDDLDTERELLPGADVWVFFEQGDTTMPVIAFYRRHGKGLAAVDVRRIRQENIEVLARSTLTLEAKDLLSITAKTINIDASVVNLKGDLNQVGNQTIKGSVSATVDVNAKNISLASHKHGGVNTGGGSTGTPK